MFSDSYRPRDLVLDILFSIAGSAVVGFALAIFTVPNDIAPGGFSGLATALAAIMPLSVGIWNFLLNVPLLIICWRKLGIRPVVFTLLCTALLSFFIDLFGKVIPLYTSSMMLASIYGGVILGLGTGILFLRGLSTGGTDLLVLVLKKFFPNVASGTLLLIVDVVVVAVATVIFHNVDVALYSTIAIFAASKVVDTISMGADHAKVIYVITDHGDELAEKLMQVTEHGTTICPVKGGYTKQDKDMVMVITRRNVLSQAMRAIRRIDPHAFAFVVDSNEVRGEGFKKAE